jgi:predicted cobalt transporter CbtA
MIFYVAALLVNIVFWAVLLVGVVYFGIRAYRKRQEETFEKRDN